MTGPPCSALYDSSIYRGWCRVADFTAVLIWCARLHEAAEAHITARVRKHIWLPGHALAALAGVVEAAKDDQLVLVERHAVPGAPRGPALAGQQLPNVALQVQPPQVAVVLEVLLRAAAHFQIVDKPLCSAFACCA